MKIHASFLINALLIGVLFADETILTKAFPIQYRQVEDAASIVNTFLSEKGAVTIQPHLKTLVVQDYETNLRRVEEALNEFDVPPVSVELSVKLVLARKTATSPASSEEIEDIGKIGEVLRFNNYILLANGTVTSEEGSTATLNLAKDYEISFVPNVIQNGKGVIKLKNFQLKKKRKGRAKTEAMVPLLSVTLNLKNSETLVLGASQFEESNQALLVVLLGKVKE